MAAEISGYHYGGAELGHQHAYVLPAVLRILDGLGLPGNRRRLFELGCGNGSVAAELASRGWDVTGVDGRRTASSRPDSLFPSSSCSTARRTTTSPASMGVFRRC